MSSVRTAGIARVKSVNASTSMEENTTNQKLARLERLVDELVRHTPCEHRIRTFMEEAGMVYMTDPIERMNTVLTVLNRLRGRGGEAFTDKN